ncbi:MAG TPA: hypothetical protein VNN72_10825 [Polyangiaceae bacterium]|nr:hypothetical protein [Polyangiaceae bacterium]
MAARLSQTLVVLALLAVSSLAEAQGTADQAVTSAQRRVPGEKRVPWHDSTAIWAQRVSTQTLGVGRDYQSTDPYFDWVFYLRPRYYLWENDRSSLSLRGQLMGSVELTNSDTTTRQREFVLEDTIIAVAPEHAFVKHGEYLTDLTLSLPRFVFPTSRAGYESGKILQVGVRALLVQAFPLREHDDWLARGYLGFRGGYDYQFARSVVPESTSLDRVRTDLEGHLVTNGQLAGGALAEHTGVVHGIVHGDIYQDWIALESEFGVDPAYKFALPAVSPVCNVSTGCVEPATVSDPTRLAVSTYLDAYVDFLVFDHALKVEFGYENITGQLGPDGQRRSFFWSPDAKVYLKLEFQPDFLVKKPDKAVALGTPHERFADARLRR